MRTVEEEAWIHGKYKAAILWFVGASLAGVGGLMARNPWLLLGGLAFAALGAAQLAGARRALAEGLHVRGRVIDADQRHD